jgi:replicative DNA helicase
VATSQKRVRKDSASDGASDTSNILDRAPPYDLTAEKAVLGSILLKPDLASDLSLILRHDDFFDDAHQKLYRKMVEMIDSSRRIDAALLVHELKASNEYELVGGAAYLAELAHDVPNIAHAIFYAEIVRTKATLRRLIDVSATILRDAYDPTIDTKELLASAEGRIFQIQDERSSGQAKTVDDVLKDSMKRIDLRLNGQQLSSGVLTHFTDFDQKTGGLHNGELIILAARPSMGKTALAMNIAEHVVMKERAPVLFISLEMNAIELVDRLLCSVAKVSGSRMRVGTITQDEHKRLLANAAEISLSPLYIDDSPSRTVSEVAAVARRISKQEKNKGGKALGLIVVDYLQLLEPDNSKDPRQEQVAKIARRLKMLAREQNVPVLCLSQLNRQAEDSKDHRPRLSHLRESGAIEQDADVVMFVHREEYYLRKEEAAEVAGQAQIIIAKQRNGPIGEIDLVWEREFTRFLSRASQYHDDFGGMSGDFSSPGGY